MFLKYWWLFTVCTVCNFLKEFNDFLFQIKIVCKAHFPWQSCPIMCTWCLLFDFLRYRVYTYSTDTQNSQLLFNGAICNMHQILPKEINNWYSIYLSVVELFNAANVYNLVALLVKHNWSAGEVVCVRVFYRSDDGE